MRRACLAALTALAVLAGGCGNDRAQPPGVVKPRPPKGTANLTYPASGVRFQAPANWRAAGGRAPLVSTVVSGSATVALWRYARREPLPSNLEGLRQVRRALVAAVQARDPTVRVLSAKETIVQKIGVIQLIALETISARRRKVRSTHFFDRGAEFVLDQYAPISLFPTLDRAVFRPLLVSLRFSAPKRQRR